MFSAACETALRLLTFAAAHAPDAKRLSITDLAIATDTPQAYAAKILQILSRKGLLSSVKGPHGGFYLDERQSKQVTAYDVVEAIDGLSIFKTCMLGLLDCSHDHPCPMHHEFLQIRNQLEIALKQTTLKALAERYQSGRHFVSLASL